MTPVLGSRGADRHVVVLQADRVLLAHGRLPRLGELPEAARDLPVLCSWAAGAVDVVDALRGWPVGPGSAWVGAHEALTAVVAEHTAPLVFALQLARPATRLLHCASCGAAGPRLDPDRGRHECGACGHVVHPRLDPAVMVLVVRAGQVLLVRGAGQSVHGAVTGFVDPGESAEDACRREVLEEAGLVVQDLRYVASRSWPGPHSLMLGFLATCLPGDPVPDGEEVVAAAFADLDDLPDLFAPPNLVHDLLAELADPVPIEGTR